MWRSRRPRTEAWPCSLDSSLDGKGPITEAADSSSSRNSRERSALPDARATGPPFRDTRDTLTRARKGDRLMCELSLQPVFQELPPAP
jgi:hypothetical protein